MKKTIRERFLEVAKQYDGEIKEEENRLFIESKNKIRSYYESGEIHREEKVICKVGLWGNKLFADEKTCQILGGMLGVNYDNDILVFYLDKYGFNKKKYVQQSLF